MVTKLKEVRPSPIVLADIAAEKSWDLKKKSWEQDKAETAIKLEVYENLLALAKKEHSTFWMELLEGFIDEIVCGSCSEYNPTIDADHCRCEVSYE